MKFFYTNAPQVYDLPSTTTWELTEYAMPHVLYRNFRKIAVFDHEIEKQTQKRYPEIFAVLTEDEFKAAIEAGSVQFTQITLQYEHVTQNLRGLVDESMRVIIRNVIGVGYAAFVNVNGWECTVVNCPRGMLGVVKSAIEKAQLSWRMA